MRRLLPNVDLRLHASDAVVELRSGGVDVAMRYGKGPFAGVATVPLRDDVFGPVCSPGLGLSKLEDLQQATLIHVDGRQVPVPTPDWTRWCAEAGVSGVDTQAGVRFPDSTLAVQGPRQLATSKRGPKKSRAKAGYVDGAIARSHVSTARVITEAGKRR